MSRRTVEAMRGPGSVCSAWRPSVPRTRAAMTAVLLAAAALAACSNEEPAVNRQPVSGSATASTVNGVQQILIKVGDDYRFHPATITVHQGEVRVVLRHVGTGAPHDWQLSAHPADYVPVVQPGQTNSDTFKTPAPGSYRFVCTIHVRQGQVGTMIVRSGTGS